MNMDVYIFLRFIVIFSEFFSFLYSVLRVSPDTDPSHRDRSVSVPAELAAETATVNHELTSPLFPKDFQIQIEISFCPVNFLLFIFFEVSLTSLNLILTNLFFLPWIWTVLFHPEFSWLMALNRQ